MTTFAAAVDMETAEMFEVLWYPEDMSGDRGAMSRVIATSMDEAWRRISPDIRNIRSVTRVGPVVEREPHG